MLAFFKSQENVWAQYEQNVLDEESWERYYSPSRTILSYPRVRNWWINFGAKTLDPGFVNAVNQDFDKLSIIESTVDDRYASFFDTPEGHDAEMN